MSSSNYGLFGAGLGALGGLVQTFIGASERKKGLRMYNQAENNFPEYTPAPQYAENTRLAAMLAMQGMPAEQYQQAVQGIGRSQQFGLNALQTRGGTIADIGQIVQGGADASTRLGVASAQMKLQGIQNLEQANLQQAQQQQQAYNINKLQRYLMRLGMASSLMQAGGQTLSSGINQLGVLGEAGIDYASQRSSGLSTPPNDNPYAFNLFSNPKVQSGLVQLGSSL